MFVYILNFYFRRKQLMIEERLLDTKRTLEKLATQTGKTMEDILRSLCDGTHELVTSSHSNSSITQKRGNPSRYKKNSISLACEVGLALTKPDHVNSEKLEQIDFIDRSTSLIENSIMDLNRAITCVTQDIVQQMVTKKIYKIRQSFREQILKILGVKELAFYVYYESGRIEFQDFSSNFITEIMDSDIKCEVLEKVVHNSQELHFVDLVDNSDLSKLFDLSNLPKNQYYGILVKKTSNQNEDNMSFCLMTKLQPNQLVQMKQIMNSKLLTKIVQISLISTTEDSINRISKLYSKLMLDLLQILIINYDLRLKKSLCRLYKITHQMYYSLSALTKVIISKADQNLGNQERIDLLRKLANQFEEMQYKKIQEIRMYQKYIRESNVIMLQFNRVGVLQFLSGNRDNCYLNDLTRIWEEGKPVMDSIFGKFDKFVSYIKKATRGALKSQRPLEIVPSVKAKITANGRRIEKIYIMIEDKQEVSSLSNSTSEKEKALGLKDSNLEPDPKVFSVIQKEHPGILKEGWLDLFLKGKQGEQMQENKMQEHRNSMSKSKRNTFTVDEDKCTYKRQLSYIGPKQNPRITISSISIENPSINLLTYSQNQLQQLAIKVLDSLDFFQHLPQQRTKLTNFISQLQDNYQMHENPFHNFKHGVNVMHTCYLLSSMPANFNILTVKDIFVNVFSGLCHDVGHTGFTNAFEIASMSRKAMIYNDKSPLQNYHASLTFQLLRKEENNFLCHMERDQFSKFRKAVIENILYTDIKEHFPLLNSFNELLKSGKILGREDAPILSYMIVHSSDFAGSVKQFQICKEWSNRVNMEFSNQYKMEGQLGIPQTPFMKDLSNPIVLSKAEGGFLKVIVYPLYQALDKFYITEGIAHKLKKNIQDNIKSWEQINKIQTEKARQAEQENPKQPMLE